MRFRIAGLDPALFAALFDDDTALAVRGARRVVATSSPGYPCRVSLEDARVGEQLVLVPFEHHAVSSPYRALGPIFIRRVATQFAATTIPPMLRSRTLSLRAYSATGDLELAEVCTGTNLEPVIERMFDRSLIAYIHVHFAAPGCFACRIDRDI